MDNHSWNIVEATYDGWTIECTYRNESGEEHVHAVSDAFVSYEGDSYGNLRPCCWERCSGDWPACKMTCPLFMDIASTILKERKSFEKMPPKDPFSFMLNHACGVDEDNRYYEEFDTLDEAHWIIAIDVEDRFLEFLDQEEED